MWLGVSESDFFDPSEAMLGDVEDLYDSDEAHLEVLRQNIAAQIFPDRNTNAHRIEIAFRQMAATPTGRARLLCLPETTKFACKKFSNPHLMGMSYPDKGRLEIAALYPFSDMELLDTLAHENAHLVHFAEARWDVEAETQLDTFCLKAYDEMGARITGAQVCQEMSWGGVARMESEIPSVTGMLTEMDKATYFDDYAKEALQEKSELEPVSYEHGSTFKRKLHYFQQTYPALAAPSLLAKIEHLYRSYVQKYKPQETQALPCLAPSVRARKHNGR